MAKISTLVVPPELAELFARVMSAISGRKTGAVRAHGKTISRAKKQSLSRRSLLAQVAELKKSLSAADIAEWKIAAAKSGQRWYNLFTQDTCYRIKNELVGVAVPSQYHAYKVGRIEITDNNSKVKLRQEHPSSYWISQKLPGKTTQRIEKRVTEKLNLPLKIGLSYRSSLTQTKPNPIIKFYAKVISTYQGRNLETELTINLLQNSDWRSVEASLADVVGIVVDYSLIIELEGVVGWLEFDNVIANHTLSNWARDKRCSNIVRRMGIRDIQLAPHWEIINTAETTFIGSVYPSD